VQITIVSHLDALITFSPSTIVFFLSVIPGDIDLHTGNDRITEAHQRELDRILQISFNPLSATMITDMDKVIIVSVLYCVDTLYLKRELLINR